MPRRPRIKLAHIPQHVVQRGVNRAPCFFCRGGLSLLPPLAGERGDRMAMCDSCVCVDDQPCLLLCQRYIELHPVRAGMVSDPAHYHWSSYRHNGLGHADHRLAPHPLYRALGLDDVSRGASYRALFRSELDEAAIADIRAALGQGFHFCKPLPTREFEQWCRTRMA